MPGIRPAHSRRGPHDPSTGPLPLSDMAPAKPKVKFRPKRFARREPTMSKESITSCRADRTCRGGIRSMDRGGVLGRSLAGTIHPTDTTGPVDGPCRSATSSAGRSRRGGSRRRGRRSCSRAAVHELGGVEVAERVGREVADARPCSSGCPAGSPGASSGGVRPKICRNFSFHAPGRSAGFRSPDMQRLLQLEAQDDVQVVRRLVGLDADERRLARR